MLNTNAMTFITYIFFGAMYFYSLRDFKKLSPKESELPTKEDLLAKYIHKVELRIGMVLFFIMINILVVLRHI